MSAQGPAVSPPRLSVAVIAMNEAHRIERCLRSASFADEVVLVDSGSTDGTVPIARALGAQVIETADWPGFGPQKNRALDACRGRWVLSLDADEEIGPALRAAIEAVVARPPGEVPYQGYWIRRRSSYCGRVIRFGDWRNDRVLRLFRREAARFSDDLVHERVECAPPVSTLDGVLMHDSVDSRDDALEKMRRYATLGAGKLRARGRGGLLPAWLHGTWTFMRGYLLRLGFLDGRAGLAIAVLNARGTWLRYRLAGQATRYPSSLPRGPQ